MATSQANVKSADIEKVKEKARLLSIYSMISTTAAGSGHPTSCMSMAELMAGTFFHSMKFDPEECQLREQGDHFVLSKGHAAPILYAALAEAGVFPRFAHDDAAAVFKRTRGPSDAADSRRGCGHRLAGTRAFGGRGHGDRRALKKSATRVYVLMGDGEMAEGQVWEAAEFAGHYQLDNLIAHLPTSMRWARASAPCIATIWTYTGKIRVRGLGTRK